MLQLQIYGICQAAVLPPIPLKTVCLQEKAISKAWKFSYKTSLSWNLLTVMATEKATVAVAVVEMEMEMVVETEMETVSLKIINNQFIIIMEKNIMTEQNYIL